MRTRIYTEVDRQVYRDALAILDEGRAWCQDQYAITARGVPVLPTSRQAVRWCARGAVERALATPWKRLAQRKAALLALVEIEQVVLAHATGVGVYVGCALMAINDTARDFDSVRRALQAMIDLEPGEIVTDHAPEGEELPF